MRPRKYSTDAERQRAYRERLKNRNVTTADRNVTELGTCSVVVFKSGADLDGITLLSDLTEGQAEQLAAQVRKLGRFHGVQVTHQLAWQL